MFQSAGYSHPPSTRDSSGDSICHFGMMADTGGDALTDHEKSCRSSISDKFGEMATATKCTQTGGHGFSAVIVAKIPCLAHFIYPGR